MKLLKFRTGRDVPEGYEAGHRDVPVVGHASNFYSECCFHEMLSLERRRTERTGRPICLMLFDVEKLFRSGGERSPYGIIPALASSIRDIDICGWYRYERQIGVVFTALDEGGLQSSLDSIHKKIRENLLQALTPEMMATIRITCHIFPEELDVKKPEDFINSRFYPETGKEETVDLSDVVKRLMDITGSIVGIILFLPFFLGIPLLIKLTSRGPVLFRQERIGQFGRKFTFLKFRSMYVNSDDRIHREYISQLMAGKSYGKEGEGKVFKITNDPRITPLGRFLRKTSLDELPQFFNVLAGQMSLVGPRPPILYEFKDYDVWHRNRLMKRKPGITGLWQVKGRSLTTFDGMVRMDLKYIREWSLWLDIRILLETPLAVLKCRGAY
ncbi:sugar transferase [Geobacter sp. DSM 9736]|uniref:sugar transferase n=1 Tax=Geobacter sp. DSM 9736 TaxID=1277350 RepID=UPI000B6074CC|nr:sugar transferase [Geobacter sp. DSM 9736]SNB46143.1 exopolysaccharide biosynthesis polyprenyl glycosylphosphotransferase [Geobacter sp. DSM 9736]